MTTDTTALAKLIIEIQEKHELGTKYAQAGDPHGVLAQVDFVARHTPTLLALSVWALEAREALEAGKLATGAYVSDYGVFSGELEVIEKALSSFPKLP